MLSREVKERVFIHCSFSGRVYFEYSPYSLNPQIEVRETKEKESGLWRWKKRNQKEIILDPFESFGLVEVSCD
ncbi:hypothetical protein DLM78_03920 [Leptospira stimsonii]|uniref:Uncharacterized protein n=1 Tax=Leptospira stimsonii TaxID=2202203 RepID=A0A8B3CX08_9LEPT|nr:hypothetical protein DLM78_03920 [Leptospira stimsonii]